MIYFMALDNGTIKIGTSGNVGRRLKQHKAMFDDLRPRIMGVHPGEQFHEREIHVRFKHLRIGRSEIFDPGEDLLNYIRATTVPWSPLQDSGKLEDWTLSIPVHNEFFDWLEVACLETGEYMMAAFVRGAVAYLRDKGAQIPLPTESAEWLYLNESESEDSELMEICGLA